MPFDNERKLYIYTDFITRVSYPHLEGEHDFPGVLRVHPVIALDQDVAPQPEPAEIDREFARIRYRVEIRGVDRRESFVYFEEGPTARRLEERHAEDRQVGQVQW